MRKGLVVGAMTGAALAANVGMFSSPAAADGPTLVRPNGVNRTVYTSDDRPGGSNHWISYGDKFRVCDRQADGLRAWGKAWIRQNGRWRVIGTHETAANSPTCVTWDGRNLPEGHKVRIRVCLKNGHLGKLKFCATRADARS